MSIKTTDVRTLQRGYKDFGGQEVTVAGWVRNMRDSKTFGFLVLADGTFFNPIQVVFNQDNIDNFDEVRHLNVGAAVYRHRDTDTGCQAALRDSGHQGGGRGHINTRLSNPA